MAYWAGLNAAAVRAYVGATSTNDDTELQTLCDAAANGIETWLNRIIQTTSYTTVTDGNGKTQMLWPDYPVTAVFGVTIAGVAANAIASPTDFTSQGYRFDQHRIVLQGGLLFTKGTLNVSLTYTAGYATIPPELLQAAVETVALKYKQRQTIGISSKSLAGESISFVQSDFPKSALGIMANYKRVVPSY